MLDSKKQKHNNKTDKIATHKNEKVNYPTTIQQSKSICCMIQKYRI